MSYQVLARKWRPRTFTEMVGQDHVLRALTNALDEQRLHHAYLFTGTRGVGKTTVARIFAKSLNCETGVTSTPCGQCPSCLAIAEGRFLDLIEVDAASRTKVEDTRELLDNVQYAPSQGRFKVYLIDEVHMLSGHSFNALLKTLEEPPPHVKFLLATTDPQKLPVTVLSRCLQFNLKRMPMSLIEEHLQYILQQEKVEFENTALRLLANGADGSMRDALSLLDQAIAYGGGKLTTDEVRAMLGTVSRDRIMAILKALIANEPQRVMAEVAALSEMTPDYHGAMADLLALLHQMALAQTVPEAVDENLVEREEIQALATQVSAEDIQLFYQVGLIGRKDLPLAPDERTGFEMALLRMLAFKPAAASKTSPAPVVKPQAAQSQMVQPAHQASVVTEPVSSVSQAKPSFAGDWPGLINAAAINGMVKQLALNCTLQNYSGNNMHLLLSEEHGQLLNAASQNRLQDALSEYLRDTIKLTITLGQAAVETPAQADARKVAEKQRAAEQAIDQDPVVQALRDNFGAQVMPNSVKPGS
ncbi:MAG: DNA polymerase III subunit gamma/tau [Gammaproteobacteria bacterium]|nr:DNA polymerase III subunit gamma/tau [Gammaproteobacteria bacterium]MCW9004194.1 DNA polymerase III subunit gamma/tau [Gammaproteobacteria bacterium]